MQPGIFLRRYKAQGCIDLIQRATIQRDRGAVILCASALTQGRRRAMVDVRDDAEDVLLAAMETFQETLVHFAILCALAHIALGKGLSATAVKGVVATMKRREDNVNIVRAGCRVLCYHLESPLALIETPSVAFAVAAQMTSRPRDDPIQWFGGRALLAVHGLNDKISGAHGSLTAQAVAVEVLATATSAKYVCAGVRGQPWTAFVVSPRLRQ